MPEIKIQHIVSVTSEDKHYPAENLVRGDGFKKWKCAAGEKSAVLVLQFEKDSEIAQIDIGNEGSAFVEVLVGKAACKDEDYQVILVASSFMSPQDARNAQNINKVRMFSSDALSQAVIGQKWNRVKVVCTQPFNKTMQYGLSFIKFHSTVSSTSTGLSLSAASTASVSSTTENKPADNQNKFGAFSLKEPPSDSIKTGTLFEQNRLLKTEQTSLTGAAAIRAASRAAADTIPSSSTAGPVNNQSQPTKAKKRSHSMSSSGSDDGNSASKRSTKPQLTNQESTTRQSANQAISTSSVKTEAKQQVAMSTNNQSQKATPAATSSTTAASGSSISRTKTERTGVELGRVLRGVRLCISGIENPVRGELRERAVEMGAIYKPDWDSRCTHLICAFENTPKYNQVKGKGRIVTKEWILDCYKRKTKLPWRKYRLGRAPSPPPTDSESSDSETEQQQRRPPPAATAKQSTSAATKQSESAATSAKQPAEATKQPEAAKQQPSAAAEQKKLSVDPFNDSTDSEPESSNLTRNGVTAAAATSGTAADRSAALADDPFNASTDEESVAVTESASSSRPRTGSLPDLPDFFCGKFFFLYGKFEAAQRRSIIRYITAYAGMVEEYMDKKVDYVISNEDWDENFDEARGENKDLVFVRPEWIIACHQSQALISTNKYLITPS